MTTIAPRLRIYYKTNDRKLKQQRCQTSDNPRPYVPLLPSCRSTWLYDLVQARVASVRCGLEWFDTSWGPGSAPPPHPTCRLLFCCCAVLVYVDIRLLSKFQVYSRLSIQNKWRKLFFTQFLLQFEWKTTRFSVSVYWNENIIKAMFFSRNDLNDPEELFTGTNIAVEIILFLV